MRLRVSVLSSVVCALVIMSIAGSASAALTLPRALNLVPKDSAVVISVNDLEKMLQDADKFAAGLSEQPMPPMKVSVTQAPAAMLGNPELAGVDLTGSFAGFGILKVKELPEGKAGLDDIMTIGMLIPVSDYSLFRAKSGNIVDIPGTPFAKIALGPDNTMMIARKGDYVLISPTSDMAEFKTLASKLSSKNAIVKMMRSGDVSEAMKRSVWVHVNMMKMGKLLSPEIDSAMKKMSGVAGGGMPGAGMPAMPSAVAGVMEVYAEMFRKILNETDSASLGITVSPDMLKAGMSITATPGTSMARLVDAGGKSVRSSRMLSLLKPEGAMAIAGSWGNVGSRKEIVKIYMDLLDAMMGDKLTEKLRSDMMRMTDDFMRAMGDHYAMSMKVGNGKSMFDADCFYEVKDPALYNKAMDEATKMYNSGAFNDIYSHLGLTLGGKIKRGAAKYKDCSIDSFKMSMQMADANDPSAAMVNAMYSEGFNGYIALAGNTLVYTLGTDMKEIQRLIDVVKKGGYSTITGNMKTALSVVPRSIEPNFLMTYNYVRVMKMGMKAAASAADSTMPPETAAAMANGLKAFDMPTTSHFTAYGRTDKLRGSVELVAPKKHIAEVIDCFKAMMQQQMQQIQMQMEMQQQ